MNETVTPFLVEVSTTPVTTLRIQYARSISALSVLLENSNVPVQSIKRLASGEASAFIHSGVKCGLSDLRLSWNTTQLS